jgi:ribonuclease BN (tRNA processing enzyme)
VLVNTSKGKAGWHAGLKNTPTPVPDDPEAALAAIPGFAALERARREALQVHAAKELPPSNAKSSLQSVLFLGTGSAAPSKYRNVTGILASAVGGHAMLDAGEGTAGQLLRALGAAGADATLRDLRLIFLSHMHADHHLGTTGLLLARRRAYERVGQPPEPLLLIAPAEYERFFRAIATLHPPAMEGVTLMNGLQLYGGCDVLGMPTAAAEERAAASPPASSLFPHGGGGDPDAAAADLAGSFTAALGASLPLMGVKAIRTVPVFHRGRAMGLVMDFESGERLVWSGDTRPCRALVEAGRGATLLIHEATFEECLREDALAKRHSTTQEALSVAAQMGAQNVILTHFSQRYPQVPGEDKVSAGGAGDGTATQPSGLRAAHEFTVPENFDAPVLYAFDLMHVKLTQTRAMAQDVPLLRCVFDYLSTLEDGMDSVKGDSSPSNAPKAWPRGTGHGRRRKGNKDEAGSKRAKTTADANRTAGDDAASSETQNGAGNT